MGAPALSNIRALTGPIGQTISEIRTFLSSVLSVRLLWGKEVVFQAVAADVGVSRRVVTGLNYPPTGFFVTRGNTANNVVEALPPASETDTSALYLKFPAIGTYKLWVY